MEVCESIETFSKEIKPGIVYLSRIPRRMNVKQIRHSFGSFGEVGRVFLKPLASKAQESRKNRLFSEGWVEFTDKRIARKVASTLNNTQVGGKRRSPWFSDLWNIKYLPRFTWGLLNERLAYERAVHKSRLRTEVAIVKRETEHFARSVKQAKHEKRQKTAKGKSGPAETQPSTDCLQETHHASSVTTAVNNSSQDDQIAANTKRNNPLLTSRNKDGSSNSDFMRRIFSGGFRP